MPELPEVETIKRGLAKKIIGLIISKVEILNPKTFEGDPKLAEGLEIQDIWRRGKVLGIDLATLPNKDDLLTLLFHLKMSGQIILVSNQKPSRSNPAPDFAGGHPTKDMLTGNLPNNSTRAVFHLTDKKRGSSFRLFFNDQRKFGWIKLNDPEQVKSHKFLNALGPEPLEKDFTWQILKTNLLKHPKMPVKVALMDQSVVAGVGNIYANEACFIAKIDPRRRVGTLIDSDFQNIKQGIVQSLESSLELGGSTRSHFVNESGEKGYFLDQAFVYDREDQGCRVCGKLIKKIKLGGRGTFYCPNCQK